MNKTIIPLVLLFSLYAHSSFFQNYCSDAEGTTTTADGHNNNYVRVTERYYSQGTVMDTTVTLERQEITLESTDIKVIHEEEDFQCFEGENFGFGSTDEIVAKKIDIFMTDGSSFHPDTIGISEDGKKVSAFVICDQHFSGSIICQE